MSYQPLHGKNKHSKNDFFEFDPIVGRSGHIYVNLEVQDNHISQGSISSNDIIYFASSRAMYSFLHKNLGTTILPTFVPSYVSQQESGE